MDNGELQGFSATPPELAVYDVIGGISKAYNQALPRILSADMAHTLAAIAPQRLELYDQVDAITKAHKQVLPQTLSDSFAQTIAAVTPQRLEIYDAVNEMIRVHKQVLPRSLTDGFAQTIAAITPQRSELYDAANEITRAYKQVLPRSLTDNFAQTIAAITPQRPELYDAANEITRAHKQVLPRSLTDNFAQTIAAITPQRSELYDAVTRAHKQSIVTELTSDMTRTIAALSAKEPLMFPVGNDWSHQRQTLDSICEPMRLGQRFLAVDSSALLNLGLTRAPQADEHNYVESPAGQFLNFLSSVGDQSDKLGDRIDQMLRLTINPSTPDELASAVAILYRQFLNAQEIEESLWHCPLSQIRDMSKRSVQLWRRARIVADEVATLANRAARLYERLLRTRP